MTEYQWRQSDNPRAMLEFLVADRAGLFELTNLSERKLRLFAVACWRDRNLRFKPEDRGDGPRVLRLAEALAEGVSLPDDRPHSFLFEPGDEETDYVPLLKDATQAALRMAVTSPYEGNQQASYLRCLVGNPYVPLVTESEYLNDHVIQAALVAYAHREGESNALRYLIRKDWLTSMVIALAHVTYEERLKKVCTRCKGCGSYHSSLTSISRVDHPCADCSGTGYTENGSLDPARLTILADALEEAGVPPEVRCDCLNDWCNGWIKNPLLVHLRDPGLHVRGCYIVDLLRGVPTNATATF